MATMRVKCHCISSKWKLGRGWVTESAVVKVKQSPDFTITQFPLSLRTRGGSFPAAVRSCEESGGWVRSIGSVSVCECRRCQYSSTSSSLPSSENDVGRRQKRPLIQALRRSVRRHMRLEHESMAFVGSSGFSKISCCQRPTFSGSQKKSSSLQNPGTDFPSG